MPELVLYGIRELALLTNESPAWFDLDQWEWRRLITGPGPGGPGEQHQAGRAGGCRPGDGEEAEVPGGEEDPGEEGHGEEEGEQGEGGAADQGEAGGHTGETEEGEN